MVILLVLQVIEMSTGDGVSSSRFSSCGLMNLDYRTDILVSIACSPNICR
jgi:hypothetical protein